MKAGKHVAMLHGRLCTRGRAEGTIPRHAAWAAPTEQDTMDRIWLKNYPAGVPHEVNPGQYRSLTELIEESLRKNAARPFTVCMDRWMSYGELDELSAALGAWLQSQGLEPGARVAIMLPKIGRAHV